MFLVSLWYHCSFTLSSWLKEAQWVVSPLSKWWKPYMLNNSNRRCLLLPWTFLEDVSTKNRETQAQQAKVLEGVVSEVKWVDYHTDQFQGMS